MKPTLLSFIIFFAAVAASAQKSFINDPNAELRNISETFGAIKVSGGIDLYLSQYETASVAVSATNEKFRENIKTLVKNNTLEIYYDGGNSWTTGTKKLKVYVSFKNLDRIQATGACDVKLAGILEVKTLQLSLTGASNFKGAVKIKDLAIELTGASDVQISGTTTNLSIQTSGASDVKGFDLISEVCTAKASGASDINITVNQELNAHASGASNISYKGMAVVKENHSSGSSSVKKRE